MPELGKYAAYVLGSYGITIVLIVGLIWISWRQSVTARRRLEKIESSDG